MVPWDSSPSFTSIWELFPSTCFQAAKKQGEKTFQFHLVGGLEIFYMFTPKIGEMIHFDKHIFQRGWFNHQLVIMFLARCYNLQGFWRLNSGKKSGKRLPPESLEKKKHHVTPGKLRWNLKITPFEKENHVQNLHYCVPCQFSRV